MTLEGSYQNLRRFIHDIETGNEFVIISSIQLEPSDSQSGGERSSEADPVQQNDMPMGPGMGPGQGRNPGTRPMPVPQITPRKGRTIGETVSLRLEMAAYFRRTTMPALPPAAPGVQQ
jgi:hypothetical protein